MAASIILPCGQSTPLGLGLWGRSQHHEHGGPVPPRSLRSGSLQSLRRAWRLGHVGGIQAALILEGCGIFLYYLRHGVGRGPEMMSNSIISPCWDLASFPENTSLVRALGGEFTGSGSPHLRPADVDAWPSTAMGLSNSFQQNSQQ